MSTAIVTKVRFTVKDKLVIADPCYIDSEDARVRTLEEATEDLSVLLHHAAGEWEAEVEMSDEGSWGHRVSILRAERVQPYSPYASTAPHLEGTNGVDSGQMFIGCAEAFGFDYEKLLDQYKGTDGEWEHKKFLPFHEGAVSSTGYGDGTYPVFVWYDEKGTPNKVEVRFLDDEDYDTEEDL